MTIGNLNCVGVSGVKYLYFPADLSQPWKKEGGNYLFCSWNGQAWVIQYVGECQSFTTRMPPNHERWDEAARDYGATQIFGHLTPTGEDARKREERDLIAAYNPPMNIHHRTNALNDVAGALGRVGGLSPLGQSLLNGKR